VKRQLVTLALATIAVVGATLGFSSPAQAATVGVSLRLMPLGDSITDGVGSTTGNGYRNPLWNGLTGEQFPLNFVGTSRAGTMTDPNNEGHSGWRIDQIAAIANSSLATYRPNVITLMIGTNDLNQNYQVSTAPARLSALVDQIVADAPDATVLVANLIVSTSAPVVAAEPAYNAAIPPMVAAKQAAGKHVRFVDMSSLTTADLSDSLHPNDGGYQKMANAWNAAVQSAVSAGWVTPPVAASGAGTTVYASGAVKSGIAGKCLDLNGGNTANGTKIQLWGCNGTTAQTWTAYSDGTLRVSGKCLDATNVGTANGTKIELWDCNGGGNQVFQPYNGGYRNLLSARCLDDPASSTTDGTQLQLYDCNGTGAQAWSKPGA
jgi:lysophospholipase L1-like esterase